MKLQKFEDYVTEKYSAVNEKRATKNLAILAKGWVSRIKDGYIVRTLKEEVGHTHISDTPTREEIIDILADIFMVAKRSKHFSHYPLGDTEHPLYDEENEKSKQETNKLIDEIKKIKKEAHMKIYLDELFDKYPQKGL